MRLFCTSDIHTDYKENRQWLDSLSKADFVNDSIILAGDISDSIERIEDSLCLLNERFESVFYIPGNHELWVRQADAHNSIDKFHTILELARSMGIITDRYTIGETEVAPLFSWYDFSFGPLTSELKKVWRDFASCMWPANFTGAEDACDYFLSLNKAHICTSEKRVVSFSHFLPRIDLMPSYIPEKNRIIYPVLGTDRLDKQIREMNSSIHIYGHSHVNRDLTIDGIRYINNAFAYPNETRISSKALKCILETV